MAASTKAKKRGRFTPFCPSAIAYFEQQANKDPSLGIPLPIYLRPRRGKLNESEN